MGQTKCTCGHSLAAHTAGPCVGVIFVGPRKPRQQVRAVALCECVAMQKAAA